MEATAPDAAGFAGRIAQYIEWAQVKGYSTETLSRALYNLRKFAVWCEERGVLRPSEVTLPIVERFQRHLFYSINPTINRPLALRTQLSILANLRSFYKWLVRHRHILYNPTADIDVPKEHRRLPQQVLTAVEADCVMNQPNIRTPEGLRDRAILEAIYSTGLRRMEIRNLKISDVDLGRGVVFVRKGKGDKDRVVPMGERACRWVNVYLHEARPHLALPIDDHILFLSMRGHVMPTNRLSAIARKYIDQSGVGKHGSCHLFRHTCATLMLEGGADTRYIQAMLGHAKLDTTQIYTHVAITKLKEIHTVTHPAARLKPPDATASTELND